MYTHFNCYRKLFRVSQAQNLMRKSTCVESSKCLRHEGQLETHVWRSAVDTSIMNRDATTRESGIVDSFRAFGALAVLTLPVTRTTSDEVIPSSNSVVSTFKESQCKIRCIVNTRTMGRGRWLRARDFHLRVHRIHRDNRLRCHHIHHLLTFSSQRRPMIQKHSPIWRKAWKSTSAAEVYGFPVERTVPPDMRVGYRAPSMTWLRIY